MLSGLARELFASKPVRAYGTSFVSMWLESKTLTGPDAEYGRLQPSQFIESTLKGYEEEARPASSEIINPYEECQRVI